MDDATSFELAVLIKNLPLELQERICNELMNIKIKDRAALGWTKVHGELLDERFCEKQQRITKVFACRKCDHDECLFNGSCAECYEKREYHKLPLFEWLPDELIATFTKHVATHRDRFLRKRVSQFLIG